MATNEKRLLVVGGPNGAGKTTLAHAYLSEADWLYLGADKIAAEINAENPESVAAAAGRAFVEQVEEAITRDQNLLIESTLSGRSIGRVMDRARENGFQCQVAFTFVDRPTTSIARVKHRVLTGGHHVPDEDVLRRFYRSISNFWQKYRLQADQWTLSDNRYATMRRIAAGDDEKSHVIDRIAMQEFLNIVNTDHV